MWRALRAQLEQFESSDVAAFNAFLSRNSILLYALRTHRRNQERFAQECEALAAEKRVVRLRSRRDVDRFALSPLP